VNRDEIAALTFAVFAFLVAAIVILVIAVFVETDLGLGKVKVHDVDPLAMSTRAKDQSRVEPSQHVLDVPLEPFDFTEPQVDCRIYSFHGECYVL
jgi:ABC-type Na+ efflux pump permease subunit